MKTLVALLAAMAVGTSEAVVHRIKSPVVGYVSHEISRGLNEIVISMDSLRLFPTLDEVINFEPAENVIGDDLIFDLDGKHCSYRIDSYDGTNAVMSAKARHGSDVIGLDWIPMRKTIWVNHKTDKPLKIGNMGMAIVTENVGADVPSDKREITIELVTDEGKKNRVLFGQ